MSLRFKVALLLIAMVAPVTVVFALYQVGSLRRGIQERSAERFVVRSVDRGVRRCERNPERYNVDRRGVRAFAYDAKMNPWSDQAPPFPEDLRQELSEVGEPASTRFWRGPAAGATAISTGSERCTYLVAFWMTPPSMPNTGKVILPVAILASILLVTGFAISFPLVRRIRRLTEAVDSAESTGYRIQVETEARDEIGDLARAFDSAGARVAETIEALHERDRTLQEYISNTTHDLAIPLTVLQHRLRRLRESLEAGDERVELIDTALEESHYIAALIKNMNVAAKLDAGEFHISKHRCDLSDVVDRVLNRHLPIAANKGIDMAAASPDAITEVDCDSVLFEQALSNLVQNAVQYTPRGGHVAIILESSESGFELRVMDDGPGIPEALLGNVLEREARGDDARSRNPEGQGFGLSIARKVCALHGWELTLSNGHPGLIATIRGQNLS